MLPPATAYEVSKFDDPEEQAAVAEQAVAGKMNRDDVRRHRAEGGQSQHRVEIFVATARSASDRPRTRRWMLLAAKIRGLRK